MAKILVLYYSMYGHIETMLTPSPMGQTGWMALRWL